ncbi:MAG: response regulator transcription factor [Gemmatimonadota bacterium]|nr:MAG: response regulator transcription factor [Gemmatimonadota bacterium]
MRGGFVRPFLDLGHQLVPLLSRLELDESGTEYIGSIVAELQREVAGSPAEARERTEVTSPLPADQPLAAPLTERELEVLGRLAERLSNKEIAKQLFLSPLTVKRHTLNIYQKLGVHGRREAVEKATALGILAHH